MKILITGSFCAGKSTLSRQLHQELIESELVEEIPREILKLFGKVDWSIPELRDYLLIKQLIEEKRKENLNNSFIIVDAGLVSILAHNKILSNKNKNHIKLIKYFKHKMYDLVFFCDHNEIQIEDDGERYTSTKLRDEIAGEVYEVFHYLKIVNFIKLAGSPDERLNTALNHIKNYYYDRKK